jgi:hypothetical protein
MVSYLSKERIQEIENSKNYDDIIIGKSVYDRLILLKESVFVKYGLIITCNYEAREHHDIGNELSEILSGPAKLYCSNFVKYGSNELPILLTCKEDNFAIKLKYPNHFKWVPLYPWHD